MKLNEIEKARQTLIKILEIDPEGKQHQPLRNLAKEIGAQQPNAAGIDFRDMIVNNINHALQTASMIDACRAAADNFDIAQKANRTAFLSMLAAWCAVVVTAIFAIVSNDELRKAVMAILR